MNCEISESQFYFEINLTKNQQFMNQLNHRMYDDLRLTKKILSFLFKKTSTDHK